MLLRKVGAINVLQLYCCIVTLEEYFLAIIDDKYILQVSEDKNDIIIAIDIYFIL